MITKQDIELLLPHIDSLIQIASSNDFLQVRYNKYKNVYQGILWTQNSNKQDYTGIYVNPDFISRLYGFITDYITKNKITIPEELTDNFNNNTSFTTSLDEWREILNEFKG